MLIMNTYTLYALPPQSTSTLWARFKVTAKDIVSVDYAQQQIQFCGIHMQRHKPYTDRDRETDRERHITLRPGLLSLLTKLLTAVVSQKSNAKANTKQLNWLWLQVSFSLSLSLFSLSCCNFSFQHFQFRKLQLIKQQQQKQRPQGSPELERGVRGHCMSCHIIQLRKLL